MPPSLPSLHHLRPSDPAALPSASSRSSVTLVLAATALMLPCRRRGHSHNSTPSSLCPPPPTPSPSCLPPSYNNDCTPPTTNGGIPSLFSFSREYHHVSVDQLASLQLESCTVGRCGSGLDMLI
ncbi:hypothetical protein ACQJBY_059329 [Aegilops geniculata]